MIAAAIVAATELMRMSRCLHVRELVRDHAFELGSLSTRRIPSVAATAACAGLRPVANAFGDASGMTYTFGIGRPARAARRSTI